jgi:hypothetical protein
MLWGLRYRWYYRDRDADRFSILFVAVLRDDQLSTLRVGEDRRRSYAPGSKLADATPEAALPADPEQMAITNTSAA